MIGPLNNTPEHLVRGRVICKIVNRNTVHWNIVLGAERRGLWPQSLGLLNTPLSPLYQSASQEMSIQDSFT